jgi:hypothetical protein
LQVPKTLDPFRLLLIAVAGWMNHEQQQAIDYLREENRVLRAQIGRRRLRFDDNQRRRLAVRCGAQKLVGDPQDSETARFLRGLAPTWESPFVFSIQRLIR